MNPADAALVRAAGSMLGEIALPFSEANIGDDFQATTPDSVSLTMEDIRTLQGEFYAALKNGDASKIAAFADAIKTGIGVIKDTILG